MVPRFARNDNLHKIYLGKYHSYLNSATHILQRYTGEEPFASFLKKFFSLDKKYGSKDRKQIAHLCYCYFRLGKALSTVPVEEKLLMGLFLCTSGPDSMLEELRPEWNAQVGLSLKEKEKLLAAVELSINWKDIFPWVNALSDEVDAEQFCTSFLVQPDLYLRLRPGHERKVKSKLADAGIMFREITAHCLALPNASKIENIIEADKEAVVQDYNSQEVLNGISLTGERAWDCCAGSGGKSLLLHDINPAINLVVSDIRESILANLKNRFGRAGITKYTSFIADLTQFNSTIPIPHSSCDLILVDAPCTGSGTWSRTPEQNCFFDEKKIDHYHSLQKKIVENVLAYLKPGGKLVYITCSVFKKENEEVAEFIMNDLHLQPEGMQWLKGYDKKADTMFVARFVSTA